MQKRKDRQPFSGFLPPSTNHFPVPLELMDLLAAITNLAELKIVIYIIRHTWSARQYGVERWMTVDEFIHGVKEYQEDGSFVRVDQGTQLSERSVISATQKAIEDGYVECQIDDHDRGRVRKYYRLRLRDDTFCSPGVQTLHPSSQYSFSSMISPGVQVLHPSGQEDTGRSMQENANVRSGMQSLQAGVQDLQSSPAISAPRTYSSSSSSMLSPRERHQKEDPSKLEFDGSTTPSIGKQKRNPKKSIPAFLRRYAEDFSRLFHDLEHTHSNLSQLANIFQESSLDQESFINCLYEAREIALKASVEKRNGQHPNRMPYFFSCLRESVEEQRVFSDHS